MADFAYKNIKLNQLIVIEGKIRTDGIVEIKRLLEKLK